jgi:hypothetical protein
MNMRIPYKLRLLKWHLFRESGGEKIIRRSFAKLHGKELDITAPKTFSEKLFSRMIMINQHGDERLTRLADKYLVREYVREKAGDRYLVELIWSGTDPLKIPFQDLPKKCVIKTNHGSGGNLIVDEKTDRNEVVRKLRKWLSENFYWVAREYHYYKIPRRILAEHFLDDGVQYGPLDYRFWCFNGKPEVIQVDNHLHNINPFYDREWNKLDMSYRSGFIDCEIARPENFEEMLEVASALSSDFDFVRVDLYNVKGKVYFGEFTFTPVAGNFVFKPSSWDDYLGQKWVAEAKGS